jgi:hypothetical protein
MLTRSRIDDTSVINGITTPAYPSLQSIRTRLGIFYEDTNAIFIYLHMKNVYLEGYTISGVRKPVTDSRKLIKAKK